MTKYTFLQFTPSTTIQMLGLMDGKLLAVTFSGVKLQFGILKPKIDFRVLKVVWRISRGSERISLRS